MPVTALIGTETSCDTPEKRALNCTQSLSIVRRRVAVALMLSTISPFLTNAVGTRVRGVDLHREVGREAVVRAPFADGADEVRLGGLLGHGEEDITRGGRRRQCAAADIALPPGHFRMPRSAEVSASEKAGRANSRSAYFISGAACFGITMP